MAATYRVVSRLIPSDQRSMTITSVVAGDEINIETILGRPAKRVKIVPDDSTDSIVLRLNNRIRFPQYHTTPGIAGFERPDELYVVSEGAHYPTSTLTGDVEYYTEEGVAVSFVQIESITFGAGGTAITIYVW